MSIADKAHAHALLIDGQDVPTAATRTAMPHGGSGFGTDTSMHTLEEYTAVKHVVFELTGAPREQWYDAVSTTE